MSLWSRLRGLAGPAEDPERDTGTVGLNLINVVYGVVLAEVFIPTTDGYQHLLGVEWSQLALAATAIVLSWIGYYNNRGEYPVWKIRFVNMPFFQYLISVTIMAGYWGLVVTAEGYGKSGTRPSARPESILIAGIFGLYWLWDVLEGAIQRAPGYARVLDDEIAGDDQQHAPPGTRTFDANALRARADARRWVTLIFLLLYLALAIIFWLADPDTTAIVLCIDVGYIVLLLVYRIWQQRSASRQGPPKRPTARAQTVVAS